MAAAQGWKVSTRSGGHSWPAWSLREGALLIDLVQLAAMSYDTRTGIVSVGPGVRGGLDLDPFLAEHDQFFPVGHSPTVGMAGFLLQGGLGWNCRGWGWAAESIESMDVVTASGDLVRCSASENTDLFWAARGSGPGFFGVVTEFRLYTRPRYRTLTQSTYVYPAERASAVLTWFDQARHDISPSVEVAVVGCTPPGSDSPVLMVDGVSFDGGPRSLAPLETCPVLDSAIASTVARPVELGDLQAAQLRSNPEHHRYFVDNAFLAGPAPDLVPALAPAFSGHPTAKTFVVLGDLSPRQVSDRPDMAFSLQTDLYFAAYVIGETADDDSRCRSWLDDTMTGLEPYSTGCYLGDGDLAVRSDRIMSDVAWSRYQRIRAVRDPDGLFPGYLGDPVQ